MLGKLEQVKNEAGTPSASTVYWRVVVQDASRPPECLLMTESELTRIRVRARKNPEDCLIPEASIPWLGWAVIALVVAAIGVMVWWT